MKMFLTLSAGLMLVSCNPVAPPNLVGLTALVQKCSAGPCSSEEEARIQAGLSIDLPSSISGDDTPELKLKGYSGPVSWSLLEGAGELFGPGATWTIDNCTSLRLVHPSESCSYSGADRTLYFPPWRGGAGGVLRLSGKAGKFTFEKSVTLSPGTLGEDERHALQYLNHMRAIPGFCFAAREQPSGGPLKWDSRLKETALRATTETSAILPGSPTEQITALAARIGYRAVRLVTNGTASLSGIVGGGTPSSSEVVGIGPDRLHGDAAQLAQAFRSSCAGFHDPTLRDFGAGVRAVNLTRSDSFLIAATE